MTAFDVACSSALFRTSISTFKTIVQEGLCSAAKQRKLQSLVWHLEGQAQADHTVGGSVRAWLETAKDGKRCFKVEYMMELCIIFLTLFRRISVSDISLETTIFKVDK